MIWSFGPDLQPVLEVEPGDTVTFQTNDCFTGQIRSEADLVTEIDLSRINGATGPVAVRGAEPGDSLVAEILDVRPVEWGVATLIPGFGQLIEHVQAPVTRLFDVRDGEIRMNDRIRFPAKPISGPHFQPNASASTTANAVIQMIATCGVLKRGCVRASGFGASPFRESE